MKNLQLHTSLQKQDGFTLIELVIVFSVLGILSVSGLAAFVNYSRTQELNSSASNVQTTLQVARSRAQSQVKPAACGSGTLTAYRVLICGKVGYPCTDADNTYELQVVCNGTAYLVEGKTLPSNITFASDTAASYTFQVLTGGVKVDGGTNTGTIVLNGYSGMQKSVIVSTDPAATPTTTLVASPSFIARGGTFTITWSNNTNPSASDWIGVYQIGATDAQYYGGYYTYISCAGSPKVAGSCTFPNSNLLPAGTYEFRLFKSGTNQRLAVSNLVSVQ